MTLQRHDSIRPPLQELIFVNTPPSDIYPHQYDNDDGLVSVISELTEFDRQSTREFMRDELAAPKVLMRGCALDLQMPEEAPAATFSDQHYELMKQRTTPSTKSLLRGSTLLLQVSDGAAWGPMSTKPNHNYKSETRQPVPPPPPPKTLLRGSALSLQLSRGELEAAATSNKENNTQQTFDSDRRNRMPRMNQ